MANRVVEENTKPGTVDWILTNPPNVKAMFPPIGIDRFTGRCTSIEGYAWPISVNIGQCISFYISTPSRTYDIELFRLGYYNGKGGRDTQAKWHSQSVGGKDNPQGKSIGGDASNWNPAELCGRCNGRFQVPLDWTSGCYVAKLTADDRYQSYCFFVVRDDLRASDLLMQCSVSTYHAYNGWGGNSYYGYNQLGPDAKHLTDRDIIYLKRPFLPSSSPRGRFGAGAGAFFTHDKGPDGEKTWKPCRPAAGGGGEGCYSAAAWEYNMVRWLEKEGYDVTYCTNFDTHENQLIRSRHRVFLSVGHDEYWSLDAYHNVAKARDSGMNLFWASGNTVWNCIDLDISAGHMRVVGGFNPRHARGSNPQIAVSDYGLVGGTWVGGVKEDNLRVALDCPEWMLENVTLNEQGVIGNLLSGYEVNGFAHDPVDRTSWAQLLPSGLKVILENHNVKNDHRSQAIWYTSRESGATVVSLGTIQWSWGLDDTTLEVSGSATPPMSMGRASNATQQFTRNILSHCTDGKYMTQTLSDGYYRIQSQSPTKGWLIVFHRGVAGAPVVIYGNEAWGTQDVAKGGLGQSLWQIRRYDGPRTSKPIIGPYKAASDTWYTIRASNGQHLIAGTTEQGGPVQVRGDSFGNWGQEPSCTQMMWRIWTLARPMGIESEILIQNVANGQLLIWTDADPYGLVEFAGYYNSGWGEKAREPRKLWTIRLGSS